MSDPKNTNAPAATEASDKNTTPGNVPTAHKTGNPPALREFNSDKIPQELKAQKRWAPWKAVWSEKRGKYDKIPCHVNGHGISTAKPEQWFTYAEALQAYANAADRYAGLGYVMTGPHDLVGIDLDNCIKREKVKPWAEKIEPWAQEIIDQARSYTELSPSGTGLRIFVRGTVPDDWTNHIVGVEIYAGHQGRFLTVSGSRLKTSVEVINAAPAGFLDGLFGKYGKPAAPKADTPATAMPDLLDELSLPGLDELGLHHKVKDFLTEGAADGDRSRLVQAAGVALYAAGLNDEQVFSVLVSNPYVMEVALDHRRQDPERAMQYLWAEHCQKAKPKATSKVATADDFEDVSSAHTPAAAAPVTQAAPSGETSAPAAPTNRFEFQQFADYLDRKPISWIIKRILPQAEVGVVYGESGAGKSFFALDLVMSVATGTPWKDRQVVQGTVAYICAEGAGGFALRMKAYAEHHDIDGTTVPLHVLAGAPNFLDKADIKDLVSSLKKLPNLSLIVVDTLAQVTAGGNENSGEDMGRALSHCKALHQVTGAMVLMVAHSGKDASKGIRGWSGIKGALDVELLVERAGDERAASITKMKDGSGEGEQHGFKLTTVSLGVDRDGEPITSCVLHHTAMVPKSKRKAEPRGAIQAVVLRKAIELTDLPGVVTTTQLVDAAADEIPETGTKRDQRRQHTLRALESLVAANRISLAQGRVVVL
ncbi:AAA family ATPase [Limnohabitans sp. Bal53]|uniref:AAA family ATPase n=1 Tax=Limnohabitans sp. Bal53 TaxID=1977910 RepID=UPI000D38486A|nr:AAA family ATPase [Limnohabitans sp. Bal53]PUE41421.1 hypothetical protein B9Z50_06855 [Limnohabitans sp. Bal53]